MKLFLRIVSIIALVSGYGLMRMLDPFFVVDFLYAALYWWLSNETKVVGDSWKELLEYDDNRLI